MHNQDVANGIPLQPSKTTDGAPGGQGEGPPPAADKGPADEANTKPVYRFLDRLKGHSWGVSALKFSSSGRFLASASSDKTACVWEAGADGAFSAVQVLAGHTKGINDVAWDPAEAVLCTASDDCTLRLWARATGAVLATLEGHTNFVFCCAFSPTDNLLVSGAFDETIRIWSLQTATSLMEIPAHADPVTAVSFRWDGRIFTSSSFDGVCRVWDVETGRCLATLCEDDSAGAAALTHAQFTPNGRAIVTAALGSRLKLWHVAKRKVLRSFEGHVNQRFCVHTCMPPPWLVCGSEDGRVCVWDVASGQLLQRLPARASREGPGEGHCGPVLAVAAHPPGGLLATGGLNEDHTICLWQVVEGA